MKEVGIAAAMFVASAGAACSMSDMAQPDAPALTGGIEDHINPRVLWIRASGPKGERDPNALPLYEAIFAHDAERVAALLTQGKSIDLPLYPGHATPLANAIALNDLAIVKILVERGADINLIPGAVRPSTPLAFALDYGRFYDDGPNDRPSFAIFYHLIKAGADVNKEYYNGFNIGIDTAGSGRMYLLNEVLDHGFNRDLPGLKRVVENRLVHGEDLKEKKRAIARIDELLRISS